MAARMDDTGGQDLPSTRGDEAVMAIEITVPTLGESVADATVARWIKTTGDTVAADEPVVDGVALSPLLSISCQQT